METEDSHSGIHKNESYYHDGNFELHTGNSITGMGTESSHSGFLQEWEYVSMMGINIHILETY